MRPSSEPGPSSFHLGSLSHVLVALLRPCRGHATPPRRWRRDRAGRRSCSRRGPRPCGASGRTSTRSRSSPKLHSPCVPVVSPAAVSPRRAVPVPHPAAGVRRPPAPAALHRPGGQGRRDDRADARRRPARRAGARAGRARTSRRASPPTSSTASATSSSATTAPTPPRSATGASPSRCAPASTRSSATASPTPGSSRTATSSTSTSPPSSAACTATPTPPSSPATSTRRSRLLVERTQEALDRAIKAVRPGRQINVIGRVIESYAKRFGYGVVRDFTGHGIGTAFHSGLIIPHYDAALRRRDPRPG